MRPLAGPNVVIRPRMAPAVASPNPRPIPMSDEAVKAPAAFSPHTVRAGWKRIAFGVSLSRVQAIIGTTAGIVSIAGALASLSSWAQPATSGHLVTTVQEAGSQRGIAD